MSDTEAVSQKTDTREPSKAPELSVTEAKRPAEESKSEEPKKRRRRQYKDDVPRDKKDGKSSDEEESNDEEASENEDDGVEEDDLVEIDTSNIISGGRRTRGKVIDFKEAAKKVDQEAGVIPEEEVEEEEDESETDAEFAETA